MLSPHSLCCEAWTSVCTSLPLRAIIARSRGFHHLPLQSRGFAVHLTPVQEDDLSLMTVSTTAAACPPPTLPSNRLARRRCAVPGTRLDTRVAQCDVEVASPWAMLPAGAVGCGSPQATMVPGIPVTSQGSPNQVWSSLGGPACLKHQRG